MAGSNPTVNQGDDNWLGEQGKQLPTTLNVLTILTFIANGLGFIWAFVTYARAQANYETVVNAQDKLDQAPDWARKLAGPHPVETARAMLDNRLPILIITLIGAALCFFGALQMRQLKKTGFSLYILGDIVPFTMGIFVGFDAFTTFGGIIALGFILLFAILYATQLKVMK
jgi:ABC-type Fe3+-siderophore transport system permease subunit